MAENDGAAGVDDSDSGNGAPEGGSPEGGHDKQPKDGEFVPKTQFIAALNSAERKYESKLSALQAEIAELKGAAKAPPSVLPKRYTRAELNAAVEARQITQDQADAEMDRQIRDDARAEAARVANVTVTTAQRQERIDREIARYKAVAPEILDDDHDTRARIKEEFNYLIGLGDSSKDVQTQLKAIRAVLGPIESLEQSRSGRSSHDPHRESGGGSSGGKTRTKSFSDTLDARTRGHYERLIQLGTYKDWAEVEEERKFVRQTRRR